MLYLTMAVRLFPPLRKMPSRNVFFSSTLQFYSKCSMPSKIDLAPKVLQVNVESRRFCSSVSKLDELGKEIYQGPLASRIRTVKLFSLTTSLSGLMVQPVLLQKVLEGGTGLGIVIFSGILIQFFTFVTPFLLHFVTKKYVRTIYYNSNTDDYTALTYNFWTANKMLTFKTDDVVVPDIPGLFTSVVVKGTPLFIEANYFGNVHHYKRIMGYDKPIDFKLEKHEDEKPTRE